MPPLAGPPHFGLGLLCRRSGLRGLLLLNQRGNLAICLCQRSRLFCSSCCFGRCWIARQKPQPGLSLFARQLGLLRRELVLCRMKVGHFLIDVTSGDLVVFRGGTELRLVVRENWIVGGR